MTPKNNILFINRDEDFLKGLTSPLRQAGYSVITAMDMRGALSALSANSVGLVVCENTLKDISGYDFFRFLKSDPLRENIPFVFFVPINDQGRAIRAFKLGAADFLVYPLKTETFISRIKEVFPAPGSETSKSAKQAPSPVSEKATGPNLKERRRSKRALPLPPLLVEVSRDGILWMQGKIKNISRHGMFMHTALLGKPGVELHIRFSLPTGTSVVRGRIQHIAFENYGPSAGIGVEVESSNQWKDILKYLATLIQKGNSAPPENETVSPPNSPRDITRTIILTGENAHAVANARLAKSVQKSKETTYDIRFYQSLIGKQLDNYKAVSFIGAGSMGGVFKGWDIALERTVALKVISYKLAAQKIFREMFIKEARFVSKLDHPNIAHIYYTGDVNQILYFAMEFVDGVTLAELIKKGENLNTLKGLNYLIKICEALDFVSQKKIIHRDMKPNNIMINDQGIVKIVDFGVAKIVDVEAKKDKREGIVGSPLYISPDAILGKPLDQRSDIYSLGASFYHAFTGFPPFDGTAPDEVFRKHVKETLPSLRKRNPKVSNVLGHIVEKMMAKRPEDRYQDYKDIIKDLQALRSKALRFQKVKNETLIFKVKRKPRP